MTIKIISLAPWPGAHANSNLASPKMLKSSSKPKILASDKDRALAIAAIDFFIKECGLGGTLLSRKLAWKVDVKSVLRNREKLAKTILEQLAEAIGVTFDELLDYGSQPPVARKTEFNLRFSSLELVEPKYKSGSR